MGRALIISFIAHATIVCAFAWLAFHLAPTQFEMPGSLDSVSVYAVGDETLHPLPLQRGGSGWGRSSSPFPSLQKRGDEPQGDGGSGGSGQGTSSPGPGNPTLAKILKRVGAFKYYPSLAKKNGLEGTPRVTFAINEDGSVKTLAISSSSGQQILDDAAIETVRRAAPLPFYPKAITLAVKYSLKD